VRECRKRDKAVSDLQHELEDAEPNSIKLYQQAKHSKKKLEAAIAQEKQLSEKLRSQQDEIKGLKQDVAELKAV